MYYDHSAYEYATEKTWDDAPEVAADAIKTVYVVGDVHGRNDALMNILDWSDDFGDHVDAIVQVGDFWLMDKHWGHYYPSGSDIMWTAHNSPIPIIVVDGNHEVWPTLTRHADSAAGKAAVKARRPLHLGGNLWWAMRGSVWEWSGRMFGALGGAVSIDKVAYPDQRWPVEEAPTEADLTRLLSNVDAESADGELDVLFTHDKPAHVRGLKHTKALGVPQWIEDECAAVRSLISRAIYRTGPRFVFHGHWHHRNREELSEGIEVVGLGCNGEPGSVAHLDIENMVTDYLSI